jgi:trk system potassium uptake protein TrkA
LLFRLIEQEVAVGEVLPLALLRRGGLEIVEMELTPQSPMTEKPVRILPLPTGCLLVAVVRGDSAQVVTGDTVLRAGDVVIALATPEALEQLRNMASKEG